MKKMIFTFVLIISAAIWIYWLHVVAHTFPAYGEIYSSIAKPLPMFAPLFFAIANVLKAGPLLLLAQIVPLVLVGGLFARVAEADRLSYSMRLLSVLVILFAVTLFVIVSLKTGMV